MHLPGGEDIYMIRIVLSDEQAKAVEDSSGAVELRDSRGRLVGYVARTSSPEDIAAAKGRLSSSGPWYTTAQVLGHLQSLEQG
jgi:hypothetical protein